MSRIPPDLARRLDRLARRAHAFHRFAHHPLCGRYRGEVVPLGRRARLCLGCTLGTAGLAAGPALGALAAARLAPLPGPAALGAGALLLLAVPLVLPGRRPAAAIAPTVNNEAGASPGPEPGPAGRGAPAKLLTRLLPALAAGALCGQALAAPSPARAAAAALAAAALGWAWLRYRRRGPDRAACLGCPSGPPGSRCPGWAPVARRERALSRLAGRWIARGGR